MPHPASRQYNSNQTRLIKAYILDHGVTRIARGVSGFPVDRHMPDGYISLDELTTRLERASQLEDGELTQLISALARRYLDDSMLVRHRRGWIIEQSNADRICAWWRQNVPVWSSFIATRIRAFPDRKRKKLPAKLARFIESFDNITQWECLLRSITTGIGLETSLLTRRGCWPLARLPLVYRQLLRRQP